MAGGTVQESPPSGLCLCNTKITCWEDLAAGAYTAGRVHGCLQALRFMLTWKYRRKVLCVVPDSGFVHAATVFRLTRVFLAER
jgi:hypothetical protein